MPTEHLSHRCNTLIIGAGIVGIAVAYYLKKYQPLLRVTLVDSDQPMALTSAQSGENYRNWWPHPVMTAFTDHSIDLLEAIARDSDNRINMTRRGYVLATRSDDPVQLLQELRTGYGATAEQLIRVHEHANAKTYQPADSADWQRAPNGVDVLRNQRLIRQHFPYYDPEVKTLIHIRRAGDIGGHQLGQYMLEYFKQSGGERLTGQVVEIAENDGFQVQLNTGDLIHTDKVVNAAGPFINDIAHMLGTNLPVKNTLQQKISFVDNANAIRRDMPFSIDLDAQLIDWSDEERELLAADEDYAWLTREMPGAIHCRPDGGERGNRVKLGWAYNEAAATEISRNPGLYANFPEVVLRGAARLNPALRQYYGELPRDLYHYGGYYTLTEENWPLIGAMAVEGTYVAGALSGFGTMAACASGDLCARHVLGLELPEFAGVLAPQRYADAALMAELNAQSSRGIL